MAYPVPHTFTGSNITAANGNFYPLANTVWVATNSTEAQTQKYMTYAGTWSGLSVYVRTANATGSTTFTVRKNGADTGVTVTVPQSTTGLFQDLSNTVHVDPGDLMSIGVTTAAGGTATVSSITTLFESDSGDTVHYNMSYDPGTAATGSQPRYYRLGGDYSGSFTAEADSRIMIQHNASIREMSVYVKINSRTAASLFRFRNNGATGNLAASATALTTGLFTDTSTSDSVVAGDLIGSILTWTSGTGTITWTNIQCTIVSSNPREISFMSGDVLGRNSNAGTAYTFAGGYITTTGTEAITRMYPITPGALSGMAYYATTNASNRDLIFQLRRNAADVNGTLNYTTPTTGWLQDVSGVTDAYDNNDYATTSATRLTAGTGNTNLRANSIKYTMDEIITFKPIVMMF